MTAHREFRLPRRVFLKNTGFALAGAGWGGLFPPATARAQRAGSRMRAVIIGHTGQGDYGHGLDLIFHDRPEVELVAVADADDSGRARAVQRTKAPRAYADYRAMLDQERPELVCLAPRWSNQRHALGMAALSAGAHLLTEKPFTPTLAQADELLAAAQRAGLRIAVAHQMRLAPSIVALKKALADGTLGDLLQMRAWGKQDERAGGEDMLVLGSHLFDLLRCFAGDALWCSARVLQNGRDITRADGRRVREQIGPVAGNEIQAEFAFARGVHATFTSHGRLRPALGAWGLELLTSQTTVRILADVFPAIHVLKAGPWEARGRTDAWERWEGDPGAKLSPEERGFGPANRRVVDDWIEAIAQKREPQCSGQVAMKSLEMIMAVYRAALSGGRAPFPLPERTHPLGDG